MPASATAAVATRLAARVFAVLWLGLWCLGRPGAGERGCPEEPSRNDRRAEHRQRGSDERGAEACARGEPAERGSGNAERKVEARRVGAHGGAAAFGGCAAHGFDAEA